MNPVPASTLGLNIAKIEQQLQAYRSLPIHTYWDPAIYEFELEAIFHKSWQYFAPLEKLSKKGDVVTGMIGRIPVAVARAEDGKLHGFVNICRHRGYTVVEGNKQNCRVLVCRYHAWSYRLNGDLANAPDTDKEPDFDKRDYGLLKVSVDTWGPGVFVNPDPDAPSLYESFPLLQPWTNDLQFITDPNRYKLHRTISTDQKANWKLWYDNGTECYHCPRIHGQSFGEAFAVEDGQYIYRLDGGMTSYGFSGSKSNRDDSALRSAVYRSIQTFPGCQIIQQDDIMIMARMTPTGADSCKFTADYFAETDTDQEKVDRWIAIWNQTFDEDAEAVTIQQKNMQSGRVKPFRYVSNREEPALYMLRQVWDAYKAHLTDYTPNPAIAAE